MTKKADRSQVDDWLASVGRLVDTPFPGVSSPRVIAHGRDLPDADLDALAEAMLGSLRKGLAEVEAQEHPWLLGPATRYDQNLITDKVHRVKANGSPRQWLCTMRLSSGDDARL